MCTGATGNTDVCTHSVLSPPAGTRLHHGGHWAGKRQRIPTQPSRSRRQPHRPAPTYTPPPVSARARTCAPRSNSWPCRPRVDAPGHRGVHQRPPQVSTGYPACPLRVRMRQHPPTAPAPAIETPLAAPRASPSSASHGANTGTVAARHTGAQKRRRTRTRTARFRPPSALRGAIVRRHAGISACTRVCMYTGGAAAGHASATHAGRAQQDAARAPTRRVRSRAPVPSHGVARGRGRCLLADVWGNEHAK